MPSDTPVSDAALADLLRPARDDFHSALAHTIEEVRTYLDAHETNEDDHVRGAEASLGAFADGRVDAARFSALLSQTLPIGAPDAERIERAFDVLRSLNKRVDTLCTVRVSPGDSLYDAVAGRLSEIGRAFGAARIVTAVRAGAYDEAQHGSLLEAYPFERWTAAERELAPTLLLHVDGVDCRASSLQAFLDGHAKFVLRIDGPAPVAPLARSIAPRTFVQQTRDPAALHDFVAHKGWGVAALVPSGSACFVHRPGDGSDAEARLEVEHLPEAQPQSVGGASRAQQEEDLEILRAWHAMPAGATGGEAGANGLDARDPAGQLATWLLRQADLGGDA